MATHTAQISAKKVGNRGGARPGAGRKPKSETQVADIEDYNKAKAKKEFWLAELTEQDYQKKAGELLDRAQVEQAAATVLATIAQTLRSIPDNMERVAGLTPEQAEEAERIIDSLCLSLHDKLKELGGW